MRNAAIAHDTGVAQPFVDGGGGGYGGVVGVVGGGDGGGVRVDGC